jgi:hypothetical protein
MTVKGLELVAVPPGVLTAIGPVVAPAGTVAWISVSELTVKLAVVPLNLIEVAELRLDPTMSTVDPTVPPTGVKELIVGTTSVTVNDEELVAVPLGVITDIGPVGAGKELGTVAWISESESIVKSPTPRLEQHPKLSEVAQVKFEPKISTVVPIGPLVGVNELIVGGGPLFVNEDELVTMPFGAFTEIGPVVAPAGTIAWISELESTVKVASVPLNSTLVAPLNPHPWMSTLAPTGPMSGANEVSAGSGRTVSSTSRLEKKPSRKQESEQLFEIAPTEKRADCVPAGAAKTPLSSSPLPELFMSALRKSEPRKPVQSVPWKKSAEK